MTIEEIVADLRDIHIPPLPVGTRELELAWTPFLVLGAGVAIWLLVDLWRQGRWRREKLVHLQAMNRESDMSARWRGLVRLAQDIRSRNRKLDRLPDCVHIPEHRAREAEVAEINAYLRHALRFKLGS